jgi:hypothetical protein
MEVLDTSSITQSQPDKAARMLHKGYLGQLEADLSRHAGRLPHSAPRQNGLRQRFEPPLLRRIIL